MSRRILLSVVAFVGMVGVGYLIAEAECNCGTCCTTDYCKCYCDDNFRRCVSFSDLQAFEDRLNFTGGSGCGG